MARYDRHAIKAAIHRKGMTLTRLAVEAGLDPAACRMALARRNFAGEKAIATFLGVELYKLWPDRYLPSGEIVNSPLRASHRQNTVAA